PYQVDPANVVVRTRAQADATRPVAVVSGGSKSIVVTESAGKGSYSAASINIVREKGDSPFGCRVSYTLSRSYNNTEDINFKAADANKYELEWGPSVNDRTHVISAILYYYPIRDLTISFAALVQSGQPVNRVADATKFGTTDSLGFHGTTDLNGDGTSYGDGYVGNIDRSPGVTRNSDRLPWSKDFDLGVQYAIRLGEGSSIELRADIFNVLNVVNLSGYTNNATQSNQIQVGPDGAPIIQRSSGAPRQFQFGARYQF
ncbi:MAG: TonB-dependent receptor, partial [Bacteroidota bacterium]